MLDEEEEVQEVVVASANRLYKEHVPMEKLEGLRRLVTMAPSSMWTDVRKGDTSHPAEFSAARVQLGVHTADPAGCGTQGSVSAGEKIVSAALKPATYCITNIMHTLLAHISHHKDRGMANSGRIGNPEPPQPIKVPTLPE